MTKSKVFWTQAEKALLADDVAAQLRSNPGMSRLVALQDAQLRLLPADRHRHVASLTLVPWLMEAGKGGGGSAQERSVEPEPPAEVPLQQRLVDELAKLLAQVLTHPEVVTAAQQLLQQSPQAAPQALFTAPVTPAYRVARQKRPTVLVVGLRGGQVEEIRRNFDQRLDIRFVSVDESKDRLRSACEHVDTVVGFVDFMSHSHEDIIKARAKSYIRSSGGMNHLKSVLSGLQSPSH